MTTGKDAQNSISFSPLDRADAAKMSDALYDILYNNMNAIAPTGNSYEEDKQHWVPCILSALENPRRQILLIWCDTELIGYFMYSLSEMTFEMEEIQFVPQWQGGGLFQKLYRHLFTLIPQDIQFVEAYAHKKNDKSQGILEHLGLQRIGENGNGSSFHYRGLYRDLRDYCLTKEPETQIQ